ncbi:uncharacterized protein LOC120422555 [Culex pipiens pallens]|uniref:uncharacterized protein LOC120422555 n=1 Tax=Culex pipiens pallens TaxID=42434 RepID=UPI001953B35E|nr:uncharacterized protein LOC120422555 [Culex pipiens pallens]
MNPLTNFEKPLYSRLPEHPGVWHPHRYRPQPIRSAMESVDPHLLDGYAFTNLYLESPSELPAFKRPEAERYQDFVTQKGWPTGSIETLKRDQRERRSTTYRRHYCQLAPELDSLRVQRMKIRAGRQTVQLPDGWKWAETSSAATHRSWQDLKALIEAARETKFKSHQKESDTF